MSTVPAEAFRRQIIALIPVYMNVFMMGSGIGWLPNAVYFLLSEEGEVHVTSSQCAMITTLSELGRVVFAIPSGILTDKYGRKKITMIVAFLHFFAWLALSLDTSLITIYVGRFIVGVATALINATALISIGEIASPEIRGQLTSIYQIFVITGSTLPSILSVIFSSYISLSWGITISSIITLLSMLWVSETPSYLITVSKIEKARNNLRLIRSGFHENQTDVEFEKLKKYIEDEKARKREVSWLKFLKTKAIRKPLLTGTLLNFFSILTGNLLVAIYITDIFPSNEYVPKKYYPAITQLIYFFIAISSPFYIEKFPRRSIFMVGAASMTVINALCALANYFDTNIEIQYEHVAKSIFIFGNLVLLICYGAAVQPMNSAFKSELYPQAVKGFGGSLGIISQASSTILLFQLYHFMKDHFQLYFMYVIFSICSFILYVVIYFLLPEGRGADLTDLQMKFKPNSEPSGDCSNVESGEKNSH